MHQRSTGAQLVSIYLQRVIMFTENFHCKTTFLIEIYVTNGIPKIFKEEKCVEKKMYI